MKLSSRAWFRAAPHDTIPPAPRSPVSPVPQSGITGTLLLRLAQERPVWLGGGLLAATWLVSWSFDHLGLGQLPWLALAGGGVWLFRRSRRDGQADAQPQDPAAMRVRCEALITAFQQLDPEQPTTALEAELERLQGIGDRPQLELALVGCHGLDRATRAVSSGLVSRQAIALQKLPPLESAPQQWRLPAVLERADAVLFCLDAPLGAAELRWIELIPRDQPHWLLLCCPAGMDPDGARQALLSQLPCLTATHILPWPAAASPDLGPLAQALDGRSRGNWQRSTELRALQRLHQHWQTRLERLRRQRLDQLLQRTQWSVAAVVLLNPVGALDLLAVPVANALLLKEMAQLWGRDWNQQQLREAAIELAKVALAQGVVDWSTQTLGLLFKMHGATWLMGGAIQAISAAHLTRVTARAMADYMARGNGVAEADLADIQRQAPLLVAQAAEQEQASWSSFLDQARGWMRQQPLKPATL